MTTDKQDSRAAFEQWYACNAFDYVRDPIGSRECGLQWASWQASREQALSEAANECKRLGTEYNANQYTAPMSTALAECEEAIRSLK